MTKILVIEDENNIREILIEILNAEDFDTTGAENGRIGVELAQEIIPDLIICDVMMPELDGYGVIASLRKSPATETIPFIFLTAKSSKHDLRQGMELGADDYLTKPFTREELLATISTRLQKKMATEQRFQAKLNNLRSSINQSLPHELRTPLNGILVSADLILDKRNLLDPSEIREMVGYIKTSGQRLYRLIQNYLLYAEMNLVALDPDRIELMRNHQTFSAKAVINYQGMEQAKKVDRENDLHLEIEDATIVMSESRFAKVVEELIDNALKFSAPGTPIEAIGTTSDGMFTLRITDRGRGMTLAQISSLGAYTQFERKLYEQQGCGLGLAIAKSLAELHGGELTIKSIPGETTTVKVVLPTVPRIDLEEEWENGEISEPPKRE